ncbi:MAG: alpha/beta fold hydrolase [Gemmataceae bacterium]
MRRRLVPELVLCLALFPAGVGAEALEAEKPYFDSNGVKIHYVVEGKEDGEPVLLIHGFAFNSEAQWGSVRKVLAKDYKVIAMDCRGHGGSDKPRDPKKYGLEMTKDAVRLLDHLKIDKAHVVGYSLGASITLQMAVRYPERIRTATLGGAGLPVPGRNKLLKGVADSLEQGKGIGSLIVALAPKDKPKPTEQQIKAIDVLLELQNDTKALAAVLRGDINDKELELSEEKVKSINVPMLALIGARDPMRAGVDELKKQLPEMKVIVIDKAEHITAFDHEEFANGLKEFLDAHQAAKN